jgi:hypothetical protein
MATDDIYLTEESLKMLVDGDFVCNDDTVIHPPKERTRYMYRTYVLAQKGK